MDNPMEIHSQRDDLGTEVLLVKEIAFTDKPNYAILTTRKSLVHGWNPCVGNLLDKPHCRGVLLTPEQLDALCAWWLSVRRTVSAKEATPDGQT